MDSRKLAAIAVAASVFTAAAAPAFAAPVVVSHAANAFRPNWGVVSIFAVTGSVIFDAIYIAATQCREMTAQEAGAATLPFIGPAYNTTLPNASKCKK